MECIVRQAFYSRGKTYKPGDVIAVDAEQAARWAAYLVAKPAEAVPGLPRPVGRRSKMVANSEKKG